MLTRKRDLAKWKGKLDFEEARDDAKGKVTFTISWDEADLPVAPCESCGQRHVPNEMKALILAAAMERSVHKRHTKQELAKRFGLSGSDASKGMKMLRALRYFAEEVGSGYPGPIPGRSAKMDANKTSLKKRKGGKVLEHKVKHSAAFNEAAKIYSSGMPHHVNQDLSGEREDDFETTGDKKADDIVRACRKLWKNAPEILEEIAKRLLEPIVKDDTA